MIAALPTVAGVKRRIRRAAFDSRLVARVSGRRHVVVLGDSHSEALAGWRPPGWRFDVVTVGGATASGVVNPNSVTAALPTYQARLQKVRPFQSILVMLGEVDCGYVIWRRVSEGHDLDASLAETLRRYESFLETTARHASRLFVMSVPLPTLPDDTTGWGEVAQRRANVPTSQRDRTDLTLRFNEQLAERCRAHGWEFVDSTSAQLDGSTRLVRSDLVRHGEADHHLRDDGYREVIADALASTASGRS
jgi:hypothetical protein